MSAVGAYWLVLMIPCGTALIFISLGDIKRIIFIDDQLCKDPNKRQSYLINEIGFRLIAYSVIYPWIRHRATTKSKWFKVFMWANTIYYYSWVVVFILAVSLHD